MSEELKPVKCGCGGEASAYAVPPYRYIKCSECGIETGRYYTFAEAITAWNKAIGKDMNVPSKAEPEERTAKVEEVDVSRNPNNNVYRCLNCGLYMHRTAWGRDVKYCANCGAKLDWSENEDAG